MVSLRATGDDFKFSQGVQCKLENSLAVRHSLYSGASRARCFNVNSYEKKEETDFTKNLTNVIASNCTLVNNTESLSQDLATGLVKEAVFVGANSGLTINRSVVSGFAPAIILDDEINPEQGRIKEN